MCGRCRANENKRSFKIENRQIFWVAQKKLNESANQIADVGDEIRKYIQEIASASVASNKKAAEFAANISKESKAKDAQFQAMTAQIQTLTNTFATLLASIAAAAKENGGGGVGGGSGCGGGGGGTATRVAIILSAATTPA